MRLYLLILACLTATVGVGQSPTPPAARRAVHPLFAFPLRQASGVSDPGFWAFGAFVDHDATGATKAFDCSLNTPNGSTGTEFVLSPFPWYKAANGQVEVIAAAAGTIVQKVDGFGDQNCSCPGGGVDNFIAVQHADGSVAFYGHLKQNALTTKAIGETVAEGEFLGRAGSSGCSSGPSLHFEVHTDNSRNPATLIDPYGGTCNSRNGTDSWWQNQSSQFGPGVNLLSTHAAIPQFGCTTSEVPAFSNSFAVGTTAYIFSAFRNITAGQSVEFAVKRPDNSEDAFVGRTFTATERQPYIFFDISLPADAPVGNWRVDLTFQGVTNSHSFRVTAAPLPVELTRFRAVAVPENSVLVEWSTATEIDNSHFVVERSVDARTFESVGRVEAQPGNLTRRDYSLLDTAPLPGTSYYRLVQHDLDGRFQTYRPVAVSRAESAQVSISPNPTDGQQIGVSGTDAAPVEILTVTGQRVSARSTAVAPARFIVSPARPLPPGLYWLRIDGSKTIKFVVGDL
jgi:hypothetical protein